MALNNSLAVKLFIDFAVVACMGFALLALLLWASPYQRGFFESDTSIRLPYRQQTVSEGLLAGLGFAVNIVTILTIEIFRDKQGKGIGEKFVGRRRCPGWVWEAYHGIGVYTFGAAAQQLTVNCAKYVIGRLRPHFYDVCQPVYNASAPLNALGYIQDYQCTGDASLLENSRVSFPSAHSGFAMYSALFVIFYIQVKAKWSGSKLLRHLIQFLVLMGAWYVGLSRVVENMHHWSDVTVGFLIGATFAVVVFTYVLKPKKFGPPVSWSDTAVQDRLPRPVLGPR